jgi:hypothetical protein
MWAKTRSPESNPFGRETQSTMADRPAQRAAEMEGDLHGNCRADSRKIMNRSAISIAWSATIRISG